MKTKKLYIIPVLEKIDAVVESNLLSDSGSTAGTEDSTSDEADDNGGAKGYNTWDTEEEWSSSSSLWN